MKISGTIVFEKDTGTGGKNQFLELYLNNNTYRIEYSEFRSRISEESVDQILTPAIEIEASVVGQYSPQIPAGPARFKKALDFLLEGVVGVGENLTKDEELIVESDSFLLLRLPWETVVDQQRTVVLRQVPDGSPNERLEEAAKKRARFLLLRSHAYRTGSTDHVDLSEKMTEEVCAIVNALSERSDTTDFHVGPVQMIKHVTKEEVSRIDFGSMHYIHVVMHGEDNGDLCLEKNDTPYRIDVMGRDDFLEMLDRAGVNGVLLFFLSFCYSGGGKVSDSSLSFELVKRGISEYSIGYDGGAGDQSALDFAKYFYPLLASGKSIKRSFSEAYKQRPKSQYIPVLYGRFFKEESREITI